jgi:peptidase E
MGMSPQVMALADSSQVLPSMFLAYITVNGGNTMALMQNTQKMTNAEKIPKDRSGISGDNDVAKNAAEVVNEVTKIA